MPSRKGKRGKLIVLEGVDGSGKATQAERLVERLRGEGYRVHVEDFPRYESFFGKLITAYLRGEFGKLKAVDPKFASMLYAYDRAQVRDRIRRALDAGKVVVANRYTTSNMVHQTVQIRSSRERKQFLAWLEQLEYRELKLPKPHLVVYLAVSHRVGQKLATIRRVLTPVKRRRRDIHEEDRLHLRRAERHLREVLAKRPNWRTVECSGKGKMRTRGAIAKDVWTIVEQKVRSLR